MHVCFCCVWFSLFSTSQEIGWEERLRNFVSSWTYKMPSVLWRCWLGGRKGIRSVKIELWGAGAFICLERGADLHMAQLMPLPPLSLASVKTRLVLPFWYRLTWVVLNKAPLNGCVCVCVCVCVGHTTSTQSVNCCCGCVACRRRNLYRRALSECQHRLSTDSHDDRCSRPRPRPLLTTAATPVTTQRIISLTVRRPARPQHSCWTNDTFTPNARVPATILPSLPPCLNCQSLPPAVSVSVLLLLHPFNGLFSRTSWVSWYQKGKTSLDFNEARDDGVLGWQRHQLDHMQTICTLLQTDNHANTSPLSFLQAGCSSRRPTNSVKTLFLS